MKTDINGCSTCPIGEENFESFTIRNIYGKELTYFEYEYRDANGSLFSCIDKDLNNARRRRDRWLTSNPKIK